LEENDYGIENDMEESISRLVLDDEADPGADIKAQRLANTHAYFMPPQVHFILFLHTPNCNGER